VHFRLALYLFSVLILPTLVLNIKIYWFLWGFYSLIADILKRDKNKPLCRQK